MTAPPRPELSATLHGVDEAVARRLRQWRRQDLAARLLARDSRLWSIHRPPEIIDRLGWLDLPLRPAAEIEEIQSFARAAHNDGLTHTVLLGMGGSSLAAAMFAATLPAVGEVSLEVIDSTHPAVVDEAARRLNPAATLFIVASKSGGTQETLSLYRFFRQWLQRAGRDPGSQLVAITDAGSKLAVEGEQAGFRRVWTANSEVGGRYSALTEFGLVPAVLAGIDIGQVVGSAATARELLEGSVEERVQLLRLGAILGEAAVAGVDKLTLLTGRGLIAFPVWLEQLVAESLGKRGRGIVPVTGEPLAGARGYDTDRLFVAMEIADERNGALAESLAELETLHPVVRIRLPAASDVGHELFRWQTAVATAATIIGVHPFDQPDVEAAKVWARSALEEGVSVIESRDGLWGEPSDGAIDAWLRGAVSRGYVGVQAYLPPSVEIDAAVRGLREELNQLTRLATTFGYGPRFLHSTGQLHKGGPNRGLFIQLLDCAEPEVEIPGSESDFGSLLRAQAIGDAEALYERRQWVLRVNVGKDSVPAIEDLTRRLAERRRHRST